MLNLCFKDGEYAFVYHQGRPVGAILIGDVKAGARRSRVSLLFSGRKHDFEILRPTVVASRFGSQELERLVREFVL